MARVGPGVGYDGGRCCVVDVRTPLEFERGHIPGAVNMPLFTNEERAEVGTLYVKVGRDEAVHRGLEFVGPRIAQMVSRAREIVDAFYGGTCDTTSDGCNVGSDLYHGDFQNNVGARKVIYLYCWRGGMRSGSVAWLLDTAGFDVCLVRGGYKAYRRSFERMLVDGVWDFRVLSGSTGCGKTELLHHLGEMGKQVLDLEGLANHKGSVFGALGQHAQPSNEQFTNILHSVFRGLDPGRAVWCENESMSIGRVSMPPALYALIRRSPRVEVQMDVEQRLDRLMVEYGDFSTQSLADAFAKITKHMGREQVADAVAALERGEVRLAAGMALKYYDKVYKKTEATDVQVFVADNRDMVGAARCLLNIAGQ